VKANFFFNWFCGLSAALTRRAFSKMPVRVVGQFGKAQPQWKEIVENRFKNLE
jgi:hypothetical protein